MKTTINQRATQRKLALENEQRDAETFARTLIEAAKRSNATNGADCYYNGADNREFKIAIRSKL